MQKFLITFLAFFLFSCGNNFSQNAENPQIKTAKVENISENISQVSEKTEDDFLKNLSTEKVILHFSLPIHDSNGNSETIFHFLSLQDFYNFLPEYQKNFAEKMKNQKKVLNIDSYGLLEDVPEIDKTYSEKILLDIFAILEKYPDIQGKINIRIEPVFLKNPKIHEKYNYLSNAK
ncbi:MAG: hypothetical protein Q4A35_03900 [Candidatus Gracilibacteria bacterium]|nr:hypothetical protein [Candidatus Gracilibacteria bacterium]